MDAGITIAGWPMNLGDQYDGILSMFIDDTKAGENVSDIQGSINACHT